MIGISYEWGEQVSTGFLSLESSQLVCLNIETLSRTLTNREIRVYRLGKSFFFPFFSKLTRLQEEENDNSLVGPRDFYKVPCLVILKCSLLEYLSSSEVLCNSLLFTRYALGIFVGVCVWVLSVKLVTRWTHDIGVIGSKVIGLLTTTTTTTTTTTDIRLVNIIPLLRSCALSYYQRVDGSLSRKRTKPLPLLLRWEHRRSFRI